MTLPKLILDTNVCGVLRLPEYRGDVERIRKAFGRRYRLLVSPLTLSELLDTIQGGDETHFRSDQELFRLMIGNGRLSFLPTPAAFALRQVLGLRSPAAKLAPSDFESCVRMVLHANSRQQLFSGGVRLRLMGKNRQGGFYPHIIRDRLEKGRTQHREVMEKRRDGTAKMPPPELWAGELGHMMGHNLNSEQECRLSVALDAAYQYDKGLCRIVASGKYNFEKHRGDWIDSQHLYYLCDPDIYLLTDDRPLRNRVGNSPQRDRILDLREFLRQLGFTPRHR